MSSALKAALESVDLGGSRDIPTVLRTGARTIANPDEIKVALLACLGDGMSTTDACSLVGIDRDTMYAWIAKDPQFAADYTAAKERAADYYAEKVVAEVDGVGNGASHERVAVAKLRNEAHKWMAKVLKPKTYSEKAGVELTGKNGGPIDVAISVSFEGK